MYSISDCTLCFVGRFPRTTISNLGERCLAAGGKVTDSVSGATHLVAASASIFDQKSSKVSQALENETPPIVSIDFFNTLLAGETISDVPYLLKKPPSLPLSPASSSKRSPPSTPEEPLPKKQDVGNKTTTNASAQLPSSSSSSSSSTSSFSTSLPPLMAPSSSTPSSSTISSWFNHLNHSDYQWLKNDSMESLSSIELNSFLHLPSLGRSAFPKGIGSSDFLRRSDGSKYLPFFWCQSRKNLLQELHQFVRSYQSDPDQFLRMAPAGPQGVGKSMYCYLIACFAAVHRYPLIYIPLASEWITQPTEVMMSLFFLNQFAELNRHWYLPLNLPFYQEIEEVLSFHSSKLTNEQEKQSVVLQRQLLGKLETGFDGRPNVPGFIIIDEHNELFREDIPGTAPKSRHLDFFRPYCNWTIGGVSVMCGSAHSKFLGSMPGGTGHTIRNLVPLTEQETVDYLLSPERP